MELDVDRCLPETFSDLVQYLTMFLEEEHSYKTAVIDTIDHAEKLALTAACNEFGVNAPSEVKYGKVWDSANAKMRKMILGLDTLNKKGINVIILAHSEIVTYNSPMGESYDRFVISCRDKTSKLLKEVPKMIGYMHKKVLTAENKEASGFQKKYKATMMRDSVLSFAPNAAYNSKNRFGLEEDITIPRENGWAAIQEAIGI